MLDIFQCIITVSLFLKNHHLFCNKNMVAEQQEQGRMITGNLLKHISTTKYLPLAVPGTLPLDF